MWRYYAETPEAGALFGEAMTGLTAIANAGVLGSYKFEAFAKAVDVGGGTARFCSQFWNNGRAARVSCSTCRRSWPRSRRNAAYRLL